jgi:O-antigen/teichoic acid export membrane protein
MKLRGPLAWTLLVEGIVVLAGLLTWRIAALHFSVEEFGGYTVARRLMSVTAYPLLLGLGIALPRAIARARSGAADTGEAGDIGAAAVTITLTSLALFAAVVLLLTEPIARLAFGTAEAGVLVIPTLLATVGLTFHTLGYAWHRGRTGWTAANTLQVVALALTPPAAVWLAGSSVPLALTLTGMAWIATGIVGVLVAIGRTPLPTLRGARTAGLALLTFGFPRVPGEIALFGMLALPPVMVAHREGLAAAGFISFSLSLVQLIASALSPVGTLLLPIVSADAALGKWGEIKRTVDRMLLAGIGVAILLVATLVLGAPLIVRLLLGPEYLAAAEVTRWIAPAALPYAVYLVLRNPIDAVAVHPHNTRNLLLALALLWILLGPAHAAAPVAIISAYALLGALTAWDWHRILRRAG